MSVSRKHKSMKKSSQPFKRSSKNIMKGGGVVNGLTPWTINRLKKESIITPNKNSTSKNTTPIISKNNNWISKELSRDNNNRAKNNANALSQKMMKSKVFMNIYKPNENRIKNNNNQLEREEKMRAAHKKSQAAKEAKKQAEKKEKAAKEAQKQAAKAVHKADEEAQKASEEAQKTAVAAQKADEEAQKAAINFETQKRAMTEQRNRGALMKKQMNEEKKREENKNFYEELEKQRARAQMEYNKNKQIHQQRIANSQTSISNLESYEPVFYSKNNINQSRNNEFVSTLPVYEKPMKNYLGMGES